MGGTLAAITLLETHVLKIFRDFLMLIFFFFKEKYFTKKESNLHTSPSRLTSSEKGNYSDL